MTDKEKELATKLAERETALANVTAEIQDIRKKKQEAEDAAKVAKDLVEKMKQGEGKAPEEVVKELFEAEKLKERESAVEQAREDFKQEQKEFLPENDPGGLKYARFQKELEKFNLSGLDDAAKVKTRLKEVYEFMNRSSRGNGESSATYGGTPSHTGNEAQVDDDTDLTPKENKLIKSIGWSKDKYLKTKASRPQFIASLLK